MKAVKKSAPKKAVSKAAPARKPAAKSPPKAAATPAAPKKVALSPEERYRKIEQAAYFIAERHGFQGDSAYFWSMAEAEIIRQG